MYWTCVLAAVGQSILQEWMRLSFPTHSLAPFALGFPFRNNISASYWPNGASITNASPPDSKLTLRGFQAVTSTVKTRSVSWTRHRPPARHLSTLIKHEYHARLPWKTNFGSICRMNHIYRQRLSHFTHPSNAVWCRAATFIMGCHQMVETLFYKAIVRT